MNTKIERMGNQGQIDAFNAVAPMMYILAKNSTRIKEIQLNGDFFVAQAKEKLDRWTQEKRIVLVFQVGNECFALMHQKHESRFFGVIPEFEPLKNKNITIKALDDENYEAASKKLVDNLYQEIDELSVETEKSREVNFAPPETPIKEKKTFSSGVVSMFINTSWKDFLRPHKIVQRILDTFSKSVREEAELAKAQQKYDTIITNEKRKQALKHEIEQSDIKRAR